MTSMISLIVVLLAAYAYSAPVVSDLQNATLIMEVENATILARRGASVVTDEQNGKVKVSLSSSESDSNETTDKPSQRQFEEDFTGEPDTKRGIDVDLFESSTGDETSVGSEIHIESAKRSFDGQPWLQAETDEQMNKRSVEIVESSTDVDETSTGEVNSMKRDSEGFSSWTTEASEAFNRRAIGSVESVEGGESSTVIVIKVQPESTTEEQPSSSSTVEYVDTTEAIRDEPTSTIDYETTVVPEEESTSDSPVPSETTAKILAIIPGRITRPQYVVPLVQQGRLTQGQNETIVEENHPNY